MKTGFTHPGERTETAGMKISRETLVRLLAERIESGMVRGLNTYPKEDVAEAQAYLDAKREEIARMPIWINPLDKSGDPRPKQARDIDIARNMLMAFRAFA